MTTIVADQKRKILAADSLVTTYGEVPHYSTMKLYRANGSIFGESGDVAAGLLFRRWQVEGGLKRERPKFDCSDDFCILEMSTKGLFIWDWTLSRETVEDEIFAVGSGSKIAMYCAKVLNYSAERCIAEVAKVELHTAPPIKLIELEGSDAPRIVVPTW